MENCDKCCGPASETRVLVSWCSHWNVKALLLEEYDLIPYKWWCVLEGPSCVKWKILHLGLCLLFITWCWFWAGGRQGGLHLCPYDGFAVCNFCNVLGVSLGEAYYYCPAWQEKDQGIDDYIVWTKNTKEDLMFYYWRTWKCVPNISQILSCGKKKYKELKMQLHDRTWWTSEEVSPKGANPVSCHLQLQVPTLPLARA